MNLERVASLLASSLKPSQVATILGVSPARISQLLSDDSFKLLLASKQVELEKKDIEEESLSAKYTAAEHALVNQVMEMAPTSELRDVTAALRVVAERQEKMKARTSPNPQVTPQMLTVVSISLPSHALSRPTVQLNSNQEVIAVGEQALAPMTSDAVISMFKSFKKGDSHEQISSNPSPEVIPEETISNSNKEEIGFLEYATR